MKVLHFNEHYGSGGGAERYLEQICEALTERRWDPVVVRSSAGAGALDSGRPRVHELPASFGMRSSRRAMDPLNRILDAERPDLVHLHNIQYFLGPPLLRLLRSRAPLVMTVHDVRVICPRWLSKVIPSATSPCRYPMGTHCFRHGCYPFHHAATGVLENLEKFLLVRWELAQLRRMERILAPSQYMHEQLRLNGLSASRLETLPPFLSAGFSPPRRRRNGKRIVYIGRIDEAKGIHAFLECLGRLSDAAWTAQIAGEGPDNIRARAFAARCGFEHRVRFMGHVSPAAIADLLCGASVLVMPSLMPESFGLTGLEAMACGVPVVAFDSGGISEWLDDGTTGYRVPWGDVAALAARVRELLADDGLAARLGDRGQQRALRFDRERHVIRLCEIYTDLVAKRRRRLA